MDNMTRMVLTDRIGSLIRRIPGLKSIRSGVTWVGSPDFKRVINLDSDVASDADELTNRTALATSIYCFTAIMYRARRVSEPPLMVSQEDDTGVEQWLPNHELTEPLDEPSPDFDMGELQTITEVYRLMTGSALWLRQDDFAGRAARFTPFSGDEIKTESKNGRMYGLFKVRTSNGWQDFEPEEVVYFRDAHPFTWRKGLATLDVALAQLNLGHVVNRTVSRFMRKAMFPGGVISPHHDWNPDDDEYEAFKQTIETWHGGPENAGTPLVLLGGAQFSRAAVQLKELLPGEILDRIEANVASAFGIPPVVLGWLVGLTNSPWSNIVEARRMGYEDTIEPRWADISKRMTRQLLSAEERRRGLKIVFDTRKVRALQEDEERRARIAAIAPNWTDDERRDYMGKEPLEADDADDTTQPGTGGGDVVTPLNGAQITAALDVLTRLGESSISEVAAVELLVAVGLDRERAQRIASTQPEVDPTLVPPAGTAEEEPEPDPDAEPPVPPAQDDDDEEEEEDDDGKARPAELKGKALVWAIFDASTKAGEAGWQREVLKVFREQRAATMRLARKYLKEAKGVGQDSADNFQLALFDYMRKTGTPRMQQTVYPLLVTTGKRGVQQIGARFGLSFSVLEPGLLEYAKEEAQFLASVMGETTGNAVAAAVQRGLLEGETVKELMGRLENLPAFDRERAKLTARTETTRAWNGAQRRSLSHYGRSSGRVAMKTWLNSQDDRVRDEHTDEEGVGGETVPIDEPFSNGLMEPSEPNCRCTMTYTLSDTIQTDADDSESE